MQRRTILLLVPSILIMIILGGGILNYLGISVSPFSKDYCECHQMIPKNYFLIFATIIILAPIPITYYYISNKMEKKLNEHEKTLLRIVSKTKNQLNKSNFSGEKDILRFFNFTEQKIIRNLLKNGGEGLQSQISKIENMTKLKVHRAIKSLEQKKIVETEHYGKTKKINLTSDFKKSLKF